MRWLVLAAPLVILGGCTSLNPAYEPDASSGPGPGPTSTGTQPGQATRADSTSTITAVATSQGSVGTLTGDPDTTQTTGGASSGSSDTASGGTAECRPRAVVMQPVRDNFLMNGGICGPSSTDPCDEVNFGTTAREFISGPTDGLVSYLLLTFDVSDYEMLDDGELEVRVYPPDPMLPIDLEVTPVLPGEWVEGLADDSPAPADASSWQWSMDFLDWTPEGGAPPGDFQAVVSAGIALPLVIDPELTSKIDNIFIDIPNNVLNNPDSFGNINLAVTIRNGPLELEINAREANANSPVLRFEACALDDPGADP